MDEASWLASTDPAPMLRFLVGISDRKLRLFACAACRRVWHLFADEVGRGIVEVAERFADGLATAEELASAVAAAESAFSGSGGAAFAAWGAAADDTNFSVAGGAGYAAKEAAQAAAGLPHLPTNSSRWEWTHPKDFAAREGALRAERAHQASLLRDILGYPFRPVALDPAWRTPTVLALAQAVYDERILPAGTLDHDRLAVLSDALEDACCDSERGCQDCIAGVRMSAWEVSPCETCNGTGRVPTPLFAHLRGPGPHVRGCFVVDLLLGKE